MEITSGFLLNKLQAALDLALNEGLHKNRNDPSRTSRLRLSSFPFCGLAWFLKLPKSLKEVSFASSGSRYFTSVGTVLHSIMQDALNSVDLDVVRVRVIADWKCLDCKHLHSFTAKVAKCKKCSSKKIVYEEITVDSSPILGHIDTVLELTLKKPTTQYTDGVVLVVIDYKTTSMLAVADSSRLPYLDNKEQIRAYVNELHRVGKPVVPVAFLVYVPRDNPFKYIVKAVEVDFQEEEKKRKSYISQFKRAFTLSSLDELSLLVDKRPCRESLVKVHKKCPHASYCASSENRDLIFQKSKKVFLELKPNLPMESFFKEKK